MRESGQVTQEQYDALKVKARQEQEAAAAAIVRAAEPETPPVSEAAPEWNFKWKNSFKLERSDGAFKLGFGGRIMVDQAFIWESDSLAHSIGGDGIGIEARRARFFFDGTEDGTKVLHLGVAYIHQFRDDETSVLRYRQRPESRLAERFADTRIDGVDIPVSGTNVFDVELAGVLGPFSAQAEFSGSAVNQAGGSNPFFWGAYGYLSWFVTGEHRNYELGKGRFGRVQLNENLNPFKGTWGAWELATRFSYLDLTDAGIRGGEMWDVTAGINWYLAPNVRVMLNYVHSHVKNRQLVAGGSDISGSGDILQSRFQLEF